MTIKEDDITETEEILILKNNFPKESVLFYKKLLTSNNTNNLKYGISHLKKSIKNEKLICEILNDQNDNLLKLMFNLLEKVNENCIKHEILNILFDITSFKNADLQPFYVNERTIEIYQDILKSDENELIYFVLLILGNIIYDSIMARNIIINSEIFQIIFMKIKEKDLSYEVINNITWLLSNCINKKPEPPLEFVEKCFMVFERYVFLNHEEILKNCYWGLCRITDTCYDSMNRMFLMSNILPNIIETNIFTIKILKLPIIRIIGNIFASENLDEIITLTSMGAIDVLEQLINDDFTQIKKEACWALSNFISTGENYASYLKLNHPQLVKTLIHMCSDNSFIVRKEALNSIYSLSALISSDEIMSLIEQNLFNTLIHRLSNENDQGILYVIIKTFEKIFLKEKEELETKYLKEPVLLNQFVELGGYEALKKLLTHPNKEIHHYTNTLITCFHLDIN